MPMVGCITYASQGMRSHMQITLEAGSGCGERAAAERGGGRGGRIAAGGVHAAAGARGQQPRGHPLRR